MRVELSATEIDKHAPKAEPYELRDTGQAGLLLRIEPGGTRSWFFEYRLKGRRTRLLLGRYRGLSPRAARDAAKIAAGDVAKGIDVSARKKAERLESERARNSTLGKFLERYEPWESAHLRVRHGKRIRAAFPKGWREQPMTSLNKWKLEAWRRDAIKDGKKPTTVNRDIASLKAVLSKAIEWELIDASPFKKLKSLKTDPIGRVCFLTDDEELRLRKALTARDREMRARRTRYNARLETRHEKPLPPHPSPFADHLEPMVLLLLSTGMRFGESTHLRFRDVNLKDRLITVTGATSKTGRTRVIPMNPEAHRILSAFEGNPGDYVFPGEGGNRLTSIKKPWRALRKEASLIGFRLHDLRHTFASRVKRGGADLYTVQKLLGHSSPLMTQRYAHLQPDDLRKAVEGI
jgi:integrase